MPSDVLNGTLDMSLVNGHDTISSKLNSPSVGGGSYAVKNQVSTALKERFQLQLSETQAGEFMDRLVDSSANNVFTRLYDTFQVRRNYRFLW